MNRRRSRPAAEVRLLELLAEHGPLHRAELARRLTVSRARVTAVVAELLGADEVIEVAGTGSDNLLHADDPRPGDWVASGRETRPVDGRAGPPIALAPRLGLVAGVRVGIHHTTVLLTTLSGVLVAHHHQRRTSATAGEPRERAREVRRVLDGLLPRDASLARVGVGTIGPVDTATGRTHPQTIGTWADAPVAEVFEQELSAPVRVENNMRLDALAESRWGAGRTLDPLLYVHASGGLGATLVIDGEPLSGFRGAAGELGHVSVDINGPRCSCGNRGCAQQLVSTQYVQSRLAERFGADVGMDRISELARSGDAEVGRVLRDVANTLGMLLANLDNLLAPEGIVIGGELISCGDQFIHDLADVHRLHAARAPRARALVTAQFTADEVGGAMAASFLARRQHLRLLISRG